MPYAHIQDVHQHEGQTGQYAVHRVHGQCHEDKGKFQRLGNAGEESRQRSRQQQATCRLFLFRLGALVHQPAPGRPNIIKGNLPAMKRVALTENTVVDLEASSAKKMFCAPVTVTPSMMAVPPTAVCQNGI